MVEIWKQVSGYGGYYEVSNLGNVRSVTRTLPRNAYGRVRTCVGKRLRPAILTGGYLRVGLARGGRVKAMFVHRLVLEAFVCPCPTNMEACHDDSDPSNNRLSNLRWDTPKANQADRNANGTSVKGEGNGRARMTGNDVIEIRKRLREGAGRAQLATLYGVGTWIISDISNGRTWKSIGA